jgi:hypothetical protein
MTEVQAKKLLREMLRSVTPGSILHLLAQLFGESAKRFRSRGDEAAEKQARDIAATLFVVGLGVDAACPR